MTDDLLATAYVAFNARDIDAALPPMDAYVAWSSGWEGGKVHEYTAVRD